MSEPETVVLVSPRKAEIPGAVRREHVPAVKRAVVAGPVLLFGAVMAVPAIAIPPHGVVSALVFGAAGLVAYVQWSRGELVAEVAFTCTCGADARLADVGPWSTDLWVRCPKCDTPWQVPPRKG